MIFCGNILIFQVQLVNSDIFILNLLQEIFQKSRFYKNQENSCPRMKNQETWQHCHESKNKESPSQDKRLKNIKVSRIKYYYQCLGYDKNYASFEELDHRENFEDVRLEQ